MVVTNNDITLKNYKKLSIQVALSGLSFCVFDLLTNKIIAHKTIQFIKDSVLEESLWKVFLDYTILNNSYDEIIVIHDNNLNTFVPNSLFDEKYIGSYLQYNIKVFATDFFTSDYLKNVDIHNIYVPYVNVNNFLLDQFESFSYKNSNTILVNKILERSSLSTEKKVFVNFQSTSFQIIVTKGSQLILFNSFEYNSPEDFIYYLLFTFEQLQLNPETVILNLLGEITEHSAYFTIAYKYIRNCSLLNTSTIASTLGKSEEEVRKHFILFHS
uniref:DUF3822 family protein n=1 Tax=Flavobacterium sp. TaxID=239 RepID=UPI004049319D